MWNYRVIEHPAMPELEEPPVRQIVEMYYDENDIPTGYCDISILFSDEDDTALEQIERMKTALTKPVIKVSDVGEFIKEENDG